jgi:hypothetical protein
LAVEKRTKRAVWSVPKSRPGVMATWAFSSAAKANSN